MILKGSQRGGGQDLAVHLMKMDDNEHVLLHELRGFASDNLKDAFKETEAISRGTKCRQYLFSLSLSPPEQENVSVEAFEGAIQTIEARLGLQEQPRAIVFHEKEGRRHAHCVWSRIDPETMTARPMSFYKTKLMGVSRDLYLQHGWAMPRGIIEANSRDPVNFSLAEWQQAKRQGVDPRWLKLAVQDCWNRSDSAPAFSRALQDRGFFLAKGDRRGHVILDHNGEVYALSRTVGLKAKDVRARLGDSDDLKSVDQTKAEIGERMTPAIRRHVEEAKVRFAKGAAKLAHEKALVVQRQRDERTKMAESQKRRWAAETRERQARLPTGLRGWWSRITGKYQTIRAENEAQAERTRHQIARERQGQIGAQRAERAGLQAQIKERRSRQAKQLLELRSDIGRFLKFKRSQDAGLGRERGASIGLRLER